MLAELAALLRLCIRAELMICTHNPLVNTYGHDTLLMQIENILLTFPRVSSRLLQLFLSKVPANGSSEWSSANAIGWKESCVVPGFGNALWDMYFSFVFPQTVTVVKVYNNKYENLKSAGKYFIYFAKNVI